MKGLLLDELSLFDLPWRFDDECWTVKVIDESTAGPHICRFHYSGSTPGSAIYFGCYAPDLVCVVAVSLGANQYGVKGRYHLGAWPGNLDGPGMGKGGPAVTDGQFYCLIVGGLACAALALWSAAGYVGARLRFPAHTYRLHREAERIIRREDRQRGQHR